MNIINKFIKGSNNSKIADFAPQYAVVQDIVNGDNQKLFVLTNAGQRITVSLKHGMPFVAVQKGNLVVIEHLSKNVTVWYHPSANGVSSVTCGLSSNGSIPISNNVGSMANINSVFISGTPTKNCIYLSACVNGDDSIASSDDIQKIQAIINFWLNDRTYQDTIFDKYFIQYGIKYKIDPHYLKAICWIESKYIPTAGTYGSNVQGYGLMQFIFPTGKQYGLNTKEDYQGEKAIEAACQYTIKSKNYFNGDICSMAMAYNAGFDAPTNQANNDHFYLVYPNEPNINRRQIGQYWAIVSYTFWQLQNQGSLYDGTKYNINNSEIPRWTKCKAIDSQHTVITDNISISNLKLLNILGDSQTFGNSYAKKIQQNIGESKCTIYARPFGLRLSNMFTSSGFKPQKNSDGNKYTLQQILNTYDKNNDATNNMAIIYLGVNDLNAGISANNIYNDYFVSLIDNFRSANCERIIVLTLPPTNPDKMMDTINKNHPRILAGNQNTVNALFLKIPEFNEMILGGQAQYGYTAFHTYRLFVEPSNNYYLNPGYTTDGLHLNSEAQIILAQNLQQQLFS